MLKKCIKIAKSLYDVGIRQDDIVSIVSVNSHDYIAIAFGVFCLNAVLAPVNFTYTQRKIRIINILKSVKKHKFNYLQKKHKI